VVCTSGVLWFLTWAWPLWCLPFSLQVFISCPYGLFVRSVFLLPAFLRPCSTTPLLPCFSFGLHAIGSLPSLESIKICSIITIRSLDYYTFLPTLDRRALSQVVPPSSPRSSSSPKLRNPLWHLYCAISRIYGWSDLLGLVTC